MKTNSFNTSCGRNQRTAIKSGMLLLLLLLSGCKTYQIAATSAPVAMYTDIGVTNVVETIPTGSVLLQKGKARNGFAQIRFHTYSTWYWVPTTQLFYIPNIKPKYYDEVYADIESQLASSPAALGSASTGYNATIQVGPRGGKYYINKNGKKTYVSPKTSTGSTKHVGGKGSRSGRH